MDEGIHTPPVPGGDCSLCSFRKNLLQVSWAEHSQDYWVAPQKCRQEPARPSGQCWLWGIFPQFFSPPMSRDDYFSKVNIPDRSFASDHEAAAKLLSNCSTIGFCGVRHGKNIWEGGSREEPRGLGRMRAEG